MLRRTTFALACLMIALPAWPRRASTTRCSTSGDAAPAWKDLEGVDGKKHSLAELADKDVVVVVFTCNSCPVATDYEDRIIDVLQEVRRAAGQSRPGGDQRQQDRRRSAAEDEGTGRRPRASTFPTCTTTRRRSAKLSAPPSRPSFSSSTASGKSSTWAAWTTTATRRGSEEPTISNRPSKRPWPAEPATAEAPAIGCRVRYARERRAGK